MALPSFVPVLLLLSGVFAQELACTMAEDGGCERTALAGEWQDEEEHESYLQLHHTVQAVDADHTTMRPECRAAFAAHAAGRFTPSPFYANDHTANESVKILEHEGYEFVKFWKASTPHPFDEIEGLPSDFDYMGWWRKETRCMLTFMGSDHPADFVNNEKIDAIEKWGIPGVHEGVSLELESLVKNVDFSEIRNYCKHTTVIGHSLGGALAQLFSVLINHATDPLEAKLTVHELYTFGSMQTFSTPMSNGESDDGCFPGRLYYNAELRDRAIFTDVLQMRSVGGEVHVPVDAVKELLFDPDLHLVEAHTWGCRTEVQKLNSQEPWANKTLGIVDQAWLNQHMMPAYIRRLRCADLPVTASAVTGH